MGVHGLNKTEDSDEVCSMGLGKEEVLSKGIMSTSFIV